MSSPVVRDIVTLQAHILQEESRHPGATGTLSWVLSALSISAKMIAAQVRRARLEDVLGSAGAENVQGEQQQKLDVIANEILLRALGGREGVAIVASEENEEPVILRDDPRGERRYCVLFDPLDGSSNLDVCGGVGTIFSILRHDRRGSDALDSLLQPGTEQVAAGYILYGSSTVFTLTVGNGVHMFVLDPAIGAFVRVAQDLRIPGQAKSYSCNEGNRLSFPPGYQAFLAHAQQNGYSSRYVGAMDGKLRLMYEANPMAMLVEQAGGKALAGPGQRIAEVRPKDIHQRVPVIIGSPVEVDTVAGML